MTKCFTFYSYKGGSGRSTTAMNTVYHLVSKMGATPEKPILIIDADLESAGLTYFFNMDKRISARITHSINTTLLLKESSSVNQKLTFGKDNEKPRPLPTEIKTLLDELFFGNTRGLFNDMVLTIVERRMFQEILEAHKAKQYDNNGGNVFGRNADTKRIQEITECFDYRDKLLNDLKAIHNDASLSDEEKLEAKREAVQNFLPPVSFCDISKFFGLAKGTVRFLGVDVRYEGEQVSKNASDDMVINLMQACKNNGYSAVIFDCGAGTQSTAHTLHMVSDVIVYCMRPTLQFVTGTITNLLNYKKSILESMKEKRKANGQKGVIILPTAVPLSSADKQNPLCIDSFGKLQTNISNFFDDFVDATFCNPQESLCEVELFKWREHILGAKSIEGLKPEIREIVDKYADYESMPNDAQKAYDTYKRLAEKLLTNS